jgi:molybdopterin-guanine dinucleotide biosynthesis protein A
MTTPDESTSPYAIVLAGGRSSRMGTAKAALPMGNGISVIGRIVGELRKLFSTIVIVAAPAAQEPFALESDLAGVISEGTADIKIIRDDIAFAGPVRAIAAALTAGSGDRAFTCSCDLPLLKSSVAAALLAMLGQHDAVIPVVDGKLQMLHAVYHRRCADAMRDMEARGNRRLAGLAEIVDARMVGEDELRIIDPKLESFFNLNTPADYDDLRRILGIDEGK